MTKELTEQKCEPCEGGVAPLNIDEAEVLLEQTPGWILSVDLRSLSKRYSFKDFKVALEFVDRVGKIAESEGHHPDIHLVDYKNVRIETTTHAISGLSRNDFILAAKIDG